MTTRRQFLRSLVLGAIAAPFAAKALIEQPDTVGSLVPGDLSIIAAKLRLPQHPKWLYAYLHWRGKGFSREHAFTRAHEVAPWPYPESAWPKWTLDEQGVARMDPSWRPPV